MSTGGSELTAARIEATRHRLNTLILVLPGQWFGLMAVFWARFVPALRPVGFDVPAPHLFWLAACLVLCAAPAALPAGYFRPRAFERGRLYPRLGLRAFRHIATDGDWVVRRLQRIDPRYQIVRDRRALEEHLRGTVTNERWHLAFAISGFATVGFATMTAQYAWALGIGVLNVAFNLYPVMHQRYKRARLRHVRTGALG
jgi:hypothetical protein